MKYEVVSYPDNGKYIKVTEISRDLTYKINSYEDLFLLGSLVDAIKSTIEMEEVVLTIPCMFQQQHDRRFHEYESFELKLVCNYINSLGFQKVRIFHPHSDVTPALLDNSEVITNTEFIKSVLQDLDNPILMSTDAGGFKALMKLADEIKWEGEVYAANKSRKFVDGKSVLTQVVDRMDFQGKDILLIDDLCVYGGTFIGLGKILKTKNIGKLYLAVSHITVEEPNKELSYIFDRVYTTNSKFDNYKLDNLEIKKLWTNS